MLFRSNTIAVEEKYEELVAGAWQTLTSWGKYIDYYSRGIGWVLEESFNGTGAIDFKLEMRRSLVF